MNFRIFITSIFSLLIFTQINVNAQGGRGKGKKSMYTVGSLSGRIVDGETKKAMEYVSVSVYKGSSTQLVKGGITDRVGEFELKGLPLGPLRVELNYIGYKTLILKDIELSRNNKDIDLGKIIFKAQNEVLNTVEVIGEKAKVRYEIDKKVINVENLSSVASETAIEILETVPSITVDIDGNVSLRGNSNFSLLIDGQPSALDVSDALRTIPASTIKDIEIITNPSAKYDAEGTSGFINIILKRNRLEGISALVNANAGTFDTYSGDANVSWTGKKLSANINGNYRHMNRPADLTTTNLSTQGDSLFRIESDGGFNRNMIVGHITGEITYAPNRKNLFTINGTLRKFEMNTSLDLNFNTFVNGTATNKSITKEATTRDFHNSKLFFEYKYLINGNKKHYIKGRFFMNRFDGLENAQTNYLDGVTLIQYGGNKNIETGPSDLNRYNIDYSFTHKKGYKIELGSQFETGLSKDNTEASIYDAAQSEFVPNDLLSANVTYTRDVLAGYGLFANQWKKLKYQVGLRAEQTLRDVQYASAVPIKQVDRLDFFPSVHTSYNFSKSLQMMVNYSRRINRPRSYYFEPFITYRDEFNVRRGNPELLPEYIDSYEFGFAKEIQKGSFSAELYHRTTTNMITRVRSIYDAPIILTTFANVGKEYSTGLELDFNYKIGKIWRSQLAANLFNYKLVGELDGRSYDTKSQSYTLRWNNNFNLKSGYKIQLSSTYDSKIVSAQGTRSPNFSLNTSLKKFFFDKKLGVTLQARNILGTARREMISSGVGFESQQLRVPHYPSLAISFSFKINNYKYRMKKSEGGDEF